MIRPGGKLESRSPVAKWLHKKGRVNLSDFFKDDIKVPNAEVRKIGKEYAKHFSDMVTGPDITVPDAFPFDVSANNLTNLWASVGWVPMYASESERNKKNFLKTRGSYSYAEVYNFL